MSPAREHDHGSSIGYKALLTNGFVSKPGDLGPLWMNPATGLGRTHHASCDRTELRERRQPNLEVEPHRLRRVRARSLTSAAKVEKAAKELGSDATPAKVAARAEVSVSTVRRYMPKVA